MKRWLVVLLAVAALGSGAAFFFRKKPAAPQPQLPLVHVWPDANEIGRVWRPDLGIAADRKSVV